MRWEVKEYSNGCRQTKRIFLFLPKVLFDRDHTMKIKRWLEFASIDYVYGLYNNKFTWKEQCWRDLPVD
jgi:hypothetical protein